MTGRRSAPSLPKTPSPVGRERAGVRVVHLPSWTPASFTVARALKKTGSFYYHCDWHASHYVKVMPIFGENNFTN